MAAAVALLPPPAPAFGRIYGHGCCVVTMEDEFLVNFDSSGDELLSNGDDGSGRRRRRGKGAHESYDGF